jgi:hypothetical protein
MNRTDEGADEALVARSLEHLAQAPLPPPATDAASLLRRFRFLRRALEHGRADAAVQRPLAAAYAIAAAVLVAIVAMPQMASLAVPPDAPTAAVVGSVTRLLAWPVALVGAALLAAAGLLWADA